MIADLTIIVLLVTNIVAVAVAYCHYDRARNLATLLERQNAAIDDHLAKRDEILAILNEIERYNASLEQQNAELRRLPYAREVAGLAVMLADKVNWRWN